MRHLFIILSLASSPALTAQIINIEYGPSHYYSADDSPFYAGIQAGTIYLEDFEDGQLNTPYVSSADFPLNSWRGGVLRPPGVVGGYVNSVDADDGLNGDFRGGAGNSWVSYSPASGAYGGSRHQFLFSPNEFGQYPTYVGFVVTLVGDAEDDVGFVGLGAITGGPSAHDGYIPRDLGIADNGIDSLTTQNHRFLGLYSSEGFTSILISNVDELDHLQYGYSITPVPEPSTYALMALGLGVVWFLHRRR